jgi:hypothetical protein
MFMDIGKPGPPPVAEGVDWLLSPVAVVTATLTFIGWFGLIAEQNLVPGFEAALDLCRAPAVAAASAIQEGLFQVLNVLPNGWGERLTFLHSASSDALLFSYAGGAYVTSLFGAGLQRAWGPIAGGAAAFALMLVLGGTLAGFLVMSLGYVFAIGWLFFAFETVVPLFIDGERENDIAIAFQLVAPPALAVVFLTANALF